MLTSYFEFVISCYNFLPSEFNTLLAATGLFQVFVSAPKNKLQL